MHCWGLNSGHLFGRSNRDHIARPTRIEGIENARSVSIGESHACVDTTDGRVLCWGINFFSQCGASPSPMIYPPVEVQNLHDARAVFARDRQTCVSRADGSLWCWGHRFSNYGSLGAIARSRGALRVQLP